MAPPEPTGAGPARIGRYEVLSHLATGGMAQIYLARQTGLGSFERHVVLKTIVRERATDHRFVTMFLDEAKLAATLNHQNVAQVYEVDQADGAYFMAMEYVHGENTRAILETTIRRGWTIPLELAVMIISGAAAGLHHAHERRGKNGQPLNIVHRDVSPANIMVGYDGSVKVLDFGIAKAEERATKTMGGTIKGKYGYMSPEQCKGKPIDRRSDIFALGIVLYELATLRRAFKGNDDFETMKRIVAGDLVLPSTLVPSFPRELEAIILTALASDPGARFQTAQELIEALDAFTVRAKLTGTNTAMGRFMVQLFGTKKEPWIDQTAQTNDHTLVTPMELDDYEDDNDETLVVSNKQDVQRALEHLKARPSPAAAQPTEVAGRALGEPVKRPSQRRQAERPSLPFAPPSNPAAITQVPGGAASVAPSGGHPLPGMGAGIPHASGTNAPPLSGAHATPPSGAHAAPVVATGTPHSALPGVGAAGASGAHALPGVGAAASGAHALPGVGAPGVGGAHPLPGVGAAASGAHGVPGIGAPGLSGAHGVPGIGAPGLSGAHGVPGIGAASSGAHGAPGVGAPGLSGAHGVPGVGAAASGAPGVGASGLSGAYGVPGIGAAASGAHGVPGVGAAASGAHGVPGAPGPSGAHGVPGVGAPGMSGASGASRSGAHAVPGVGAPGIPRSGAHLAPGASGHALPGVPHSGAHAVPGASGAHAVPGVPHSGAHAIGPSGLPLLQPDARPSSPHLASTLIGHGPLIPAAPSGLPALVQDDISQVGARSLVTDPKLGWDTSIAHPAANDGSHTRIPSEVVDFRIRSNAKWWLLSVVLVIFVVVMIVLILST